jgi:hypothetical protein
VNVVGVFMHNLMEHAQRKAFLDTRNCIAARLEMEDENEKLVRRLFSYDTFAPAYLWRDKKSRILKRNIFYERAYGAIEVALLHRATSH